MIVVEPPAYSAKGVAQDGNADMCVYDTHRRHPSREGVLFSRAVCSLKGTAPDLIGKRSTRLIRSDASPPVNPVLHRDAARAEILVDIALRIGEAGTACERLHVPPATTCCRYLARPARDRRRARHRRALPAWPTEPAQYPAAASTEAAEDERATRIQGARA